MNKRQNAQLQMFQAIQDVCAKYQTVTTTRPAFVTFYDGFNQKIESLDDSAEKTFVQTTGFAQEKNDDKETLCANAFTIASAVTAFAIQQKDVVLRAKVSYSLSDLMRLRDSDLPTAAFIIAGLAQENLSAMTGFGITQAMINALNTGSKSFKNDSATPRSTISQKKTQNQVKADIIKEANFILRQQMMKMLPTFTAESPEFVTDFKNASRLIIFGVRHRKKQEEARAHQPAHDETGKESLLVKVA